MPGRRNALLAASQMIAEIDALAQAHPPQAVTTVGHLDVSPNSRNTIPGHVYFTVDIRHPQAPTLDTLEAALESLIARAASGHGVETKHQRIQYTLPVEFDADCIAAVQRACQTLGVPHRQMWSGAGHDSCYVSQVAPTSMIFVPCAGGLSHNEAESATPEDLAAGCDVLLNAVLDRAA